MSATISETITDALRITRASTGLTREELVAAAVKAGAPEKTFTVSALRNLETGRRNPSVDELVWLATALHVAPRALLGDHADLFGALPERPACGPVEEATRRAVEQLDLADHHAALAESAYALAAALDGGGLQSPAPVARELRATLAEIWAAQAPDADDDDDFDPE